MKKLTLIPVILFLLAQTAFAGGILTNSNQSAQFVRMLSRNASTQIDAVYFNPAGLMKMESGFHFAVHNQSVFQTRTIVSNYPYLNNSEYLGDVAAPVFPSAFAVYKTDNLAFSLGFGPNGGGGSANYKKGLPSFEKDFVNLSSGFARLHPLFAPYYIDQITGYDTDISFEGTSVFWGIQLGISAKINDAFSVYGGVRYLPSANTYTGSIEKIELRTGGGNLAASTYQSITKPILDGTIASLATAYGGLNNAIEAGYIDGNASVSDPIILHLIGAFSGTPGTNQDAVAFLEGTASGIQILANADLSDKEVKTKQTGAGFSPIIGVNISPNDKLNIGLKYEFKTTLVLTNETEVDDTGLFPDKVESNSDLPAILTAGVEYKFSDKFDASVSYNTYFDKDVDWGNNTLGQERTIDNNYWELALGLQYHISDVFTISAGGMRSKTGVSEQYNSDFSYSNSSITGAVGFEWKASDRLTLDAGVMVTNYESTDKNFGTYTENYDKETLGFAVGVSYSIFQ